MPFYHASNIEGLKEIRPLSKSKDKNCEEKVAYFTTLKTDALFYIRDMDANHVTSDVVEDNIVECHEFFQTI